MSNRDSLGHGDLLPQDVMDIFAQEKLSKKGRKQRRRSLGRALGWLKGKKNKNVGNKGQNPGLGPAFDLALDGHPAGYQGAPKGTHKSGKQGHQQGNSNALPKRDDGDEKTPAPLVLPENVFIEVSRPKYLEDLHSEALEGLKLMQQEERVIGPEYQDTESTISTVSVRAEVDGGGFTTDSTIPDTSSTVSMQTTASSRSSRSGLTRQGSTFRPLNSGKKSDKGRTRRRHRKTIGGIPQHLQREFGLDRAEWTVRPQSEEDCVNGDSDVPELAVHSPEANDTEGHPLSHVQEELSAAQNAHVDDIALLQRLGTVKSGGDRPWSLAVPGMTTAGSGQPGPPSPVMSMSPQAAYLSKIIPNAVLPPSIEVVEISRGSSRNSVRTVSKSSLVLSSPTSSRASSRASTARSISSRSSTITSASRHNHFHLSDSSCWSNSDSDTLVSDSSTISSSSTPRQREAQDKKLNKGSVHTDSPKHPSNGKIIKGNESKKDGPFVRSLSVMKPKRAPPPPNRSYSLHNKMKRRSRDLADVKIIPNQTSEGNLKKIDSPGYNADTSSLDESTGFKTPSPLKSQLNVDFTQNSVATDASNAKTEALEANNYKILSPSSGYSSQDATSPKQPSPNHKKGLLAKLHKLFPPSPAADLSTSSVTQQEGSGARASTVNEKPSVKALRELFTIPPHPKVHAPPPPPPEVWSHSPRSIELLLGPPAPGNTYAVVKKNPKDKRPYRQPASTSTEGAVRAVEQKQSSSITVESKKVCQEGSLNVANRTNDGERLIQKSIDMKEHGKVQVSEILNSVLVRTVARDADRLPVIAEERKTSAQTIKNPSISSVHISPRLPTKQTADVPTVVSPRHVTSPESSWPPPPPPVSQAGLGSPDETDFPLPPPPISTEVEIVPPVPPNEPVPAASTSLQGNKAPPLNIPPPPNYTAPLPPIKTFAFSEKVKMFSAQPNVDVSPLKISPPPKEAIAPPKISKPSPLASPPKEITHTATLAQSTNDSTPPAQKPAIPTQPEAPPSPQQKLLVHIVPTKIIHTPTTKPTLLPSNSEVPPPPDLIPPPPSKEVVVVSSVVADRPVPTSLQKDVPPSAEEVASEPPEASSLQLDVTNINCPSVIITEVSVTPPVPPQPQSVDVVLVPPQVSTSPPEEVFTSVQTTQIEVTVPPAEIPTSPAVPISKPEVSQPSIQEISRAQLVPIHIEMSVSPSKDLSPQPPVEEHSEAPPEVAQAPLEVISPSPKEASSLEIVVADVAEPQVTEDSAPSVVEERFLPVVVEVSYPELSEETSTDAVEEGLEDSQKSEGSETSPTENSKSITSPDTDSSQKSEPAPKTEIECSEEEIDSSLPPWKSILTPPQSIPPPPPLEQPNLPSNEPNRVEEIPLQPEPNKSDSVATLPEASPPTESTTPQEKVDIILVPSSPTEEVPKQEKVDIILVPSSPTEEVPKQEKVDIILVPSSPTEEVPKQEPASDTVEHQSEEPAPVPIIETESKNANLTKDQAINGSPESPKTDVEAKPKEKEEPNSQAQTSTATEAPQKPIRRSLVISSPPSPPATAATSPTPFNKGPSPHTAVPTTHTRSPPAMAPSMNLQEAIRLRTAARSHNGPSSRLGIHSPPGFDVRKSPTSTASFIFSKSNKKMVIETKPEAKVEKKTEGPVTKASAEQTTKKELKVPPPVAKKPTTKTKDTESDDIEQTAGQEIQSETIKDDTKKPNGTARTVEGH